MVNWCRRRVLAAVSSTSALGIGGCFGDDERGHNGDNGANGTGGESDTELEDRPVFLKELKSDCSTDDDPVDHDDPHTPRIHVVAGEPSSNVGLDVELIQEYTAEHPGEIQITMINEADQVREFEYGPSPLSHGEHDSVDAYLHAEYSGNTYDEPENGCWRSLNHLGGEPELTGATLDPGESVSESYELLAAADDEYCLPGGLYWFESTLFVNGEDGDVDEVALEWAACLE